MSAGSIFESGLSINVGVESERNDACPYHILLSYQDCFVPPLSLVSRVRAQQHSITASAVPPWSIQVHYLIQAFEIFTSSFDPLAIHHINQSFPLMRSIISARSLDEARKLSTAISLCVPSCLSPMERYHYESVVGSSYPGAHLAPLCGDDLPIVVDTGAITLPFSHSIGLRFFQAASSMFAWNLCGNKY